jgi:hypothetical protein
MAIVVLTSLSACAGTTHQAVVATTRATVPTATTTVARTTTVPTTVVVVTTPPTTDPVREPPLLPATTTTVPLPSSTEPPVTVAATGESPTWASYEPRPGVAGVAALTNAAGRAELENVPALAVKVDNHPAARPQWSLSIADVIFEENVESLTRFIAIFHSRLPDTIGPIRSARTSDLNILAAFNRPVLAWSGGNKNVTAAVRSAASSGILVNISAQSIGRCYRRVSGRKAPHNLVVDPPCAMGAASSAGPARAPWTFDDAYVPLGQPDTAFDVRMDAVDVTWRWDPASGKYLRSQNGRAHVAADGWQIAATNVVVMSVQYIPSPADVRSPEAQTLEAGDVVVHRNGIAVSGTWSRASATDPFVFANYGGTPIPLASGTTFVELVRA